MTIKRIGLLAALLILVGSVAFNRANSSESDELWQYRNLGKAFYENPTTQYQAVDMFKKALELAPDSPRERINYGLALLRAGKTDEGIAELEAVQKDAPQIPHTWFNLGIIFKKAAQYDKAREQFEKMVQLVPDEPISHYNLGVVLKLTGDASGSLKQFEEAARLGPSLAGPYFQLFNAYKAAGREAEADRALAKFNENKRRQSGAAIPEDLDWSFFSEILDVVDPVAAPTLSAAKFQSALSFDSEVMGGKLEGTPEGIVVGDRQADGTTETIAWTDRQVRMVPSSPGGDPVIAFDADAGETIRSVTAADFDNDGLFDLSVVTDRRVVLLKRDASGFIAQQESANDGQYDFSLWHDLDHDSDLDLFLLGKGHALLRNSGKSGFVDSTTEFPFVDGDVSAAASVDLIKDTNGTDLVFAYVNHPAVLYRDMLAGSYEPKEIEALPKEVSELRAFDVDNDGWTDLLAHTPGGVQLIINREGSFSAGAVIESTGRATPADMANRGFSDLAFAGKVFPNQGRGEFGPGVEVPALAGAVAIDAGDLDQDGKIDLVVLGQDGAVSCLKGRGAEGNWNVIGLEGVRNLREAPSAEVEIKAGSLYQKRIYDGRPIHVGLGTHSKIDTVRITWPNGLIQNEPEQDVNRAIVYKEKQRLSGSCPMVFTWNGKKFQFITDVLGVAPLGAAAGEGVFFPVDHDEYVQIPAGAMAKNGDGHYEVRITEELREVGYIDKVQLLAVDHPAGESIFTSDKFKSPPFPKFRLYGVRDRQYPVAAFDDRGNDVRDRVRKLDRTYPDAFERDFLGVAEKHFVELDFGSARSIGEPAILVLNGWVDWADGSTIRRLAQDRTAQLIMPQLQVQDPSGRWVTAVEDMGVPAGKPKTIVVDLTGKFLSASRKVRIVTSLSVYWDEIFMSRDVAVPKVQPVVLSLAQADLSYRGFSTPVIHPQRRQPEVFDYSKWMPLSMWNPAKGFYTRYGDVAALLGGIDDQFLIMGSGDEIRLTFTDERLGPVPEGYTRDFLLFVDGWAKDGDLNTAYSQTVEPLPFHGMSAYPYPATESYPDTPAHRQYREEYNTRPGLRFIRSLTEERSPDAPGVAHSE